MDESDLPSARPPFNNMYNINEIMKGLASCKIPPQQFLYRRRRK